MEELTISRNDFEKEASKTFRGLFAEEDFRDVTLVSADSKLISAHKVVLSSISPFFRKIFKLHQSPLIFLKGVNSLDLDLLLRFIYLGECQVAEESLSTFLELGEELEVDGLIQKDNGHGTPSKIAQQTDNELKEYQTNESTRDGLFKCSACDFKFKNKDYLNKHFLTKHVEIERSIPKIEAQNHDTKDFKEKENDVAKLPQEDGNQAMEENVTKCVDKIKSSSVEEIFKTLLEGFDTDKNYEDKREEEEFQDNAGKEIHDDADVAEKISTDSFQQGESCEDTLGPNESIENNQDANVAENNMKFPCTVENCGFVGICRRGLKRHKTVKHKLGLKKERHGKKAGRLVCDVGTCKFRSKLRSGLRRHKTLKHSQEKEAVSNLESKMRSTLTESENSEEHTCDICQFKAASQVFLQNHKASIHGAKSYTCDQCDFHSGWQSSLYTHKATKHEAPITGAKTFACDQCDFQSRHQSSLYIHTKTKHEGRLFKCDHCDFSSSYKRQLKSHMQKKHEEDSHISNDVSNASADNLNKGEPLVTDTQGKEDNLKKEDNLTKDDNLNKEDNLKKEDNRFQVNLKKGESGQQGLATDLSIYPQIKCSILSRS